MKNKKLILIFFVLAALILLGFAWLSPTEFTGKDTKVKEKNDIDGPSIGTPAPYDPITATTVPKTGWKTYSSPQYGFSFEYPSDYKLETRPGEEKLLFSLEIIPANAKTPNETGSDRFSLSVTSDPIVSIVNEFTNSGIENVSVKDVSLNGLSGKLIQSEYGFTGDLENHVLFENDKKQVIHIYYFQYTGDGSPMTVPNSVFDTVLQSLRLNS